MGSSSSIASIAALTGNVDKVDFTWTNKFNHDDVDLIRIWAAPCRYETNDIIEGNKHLLLALEYFQEQGIITLTDDDTATLRTSSLPAEQRAGKRFYEHSVYLTVQNAYMKIIARYVGTQLQAVSDYKYILPQEGLFKREEDHLKRDVKLKDGLKWHVLKKNIEAFEYKQRTGEKMP